RRPPTPTLFPYTTLFRSVRRGDPAAVDQDRAPVGQPQRREDVDARHALVRPAAQDDAARDVVPPLDLDGPVQQADGVLGHVPQRDRKSTRLNSSHVKISY